MQLKNSLGSLCLGVVLIVAGCGKGKSGVVYFGNLKDSQEVESPFVVQMKSENVVIDTSNGNSFRIVVDSPLTVSSQSVPKDSISIRYGSGQTATLNLPEGNHTLTLQLLKGGQVIADPQACQQIHIRVTKRNPVPVQEDE